MPATDPRIDHIEDQLATLLSGYQRYEQHDAPKPPATPTGLSVATAKPGEATLQWQLVPDAAAYEAMYSGAGVDSAVRETTTPSVSWQLPAGDYVFAVRARNASGVSGWAREPGTVRGEIVVGDDKTPYPIPADAPRFDGGADLSKLPDRAVLRAKAKYVISGKLRPGQKIWSEAVGDDRAMVVLKDKQQVDLTGVSRVSIWGAGSTGGGLPERENHRAAWLIGDGAWLEDFYVTKSAGAGITMDGNGITSVRLVSEFNDGAGRGGNSCHDYRELYSIIRGNNRVLVDRSGGGGKILKTRNCYIEGAQIYDNQGAGIWFDFNNVGITLKLCKFWGQIHWTKSGASFDPFGTARDITIEADFDGPTLIDQCWFGGSEGPRISICESKRVTISNCDFHSLPATSKSTRRLAAIAFRDLARPGVDGKKRGGWLQDIFVTGNKFEDGMQVIPEDGGGSVRLKASNINFSGNTGNLVMKIPA